MGRCLENIEAYALIERRRYLKNTMRHSLQYMAGIGAISIRVGVKSSVLQHEAWKGSLKSMCGLQNLETQTRLPLDMMFSRAVPGSVGF